MSFLKFILLFLFPSNISGGCQTVNIKLSGKQEVCTGHDFNITCQFDCYGYRVMLMKGKQVEHRLEIDNNNVSFSKHIHSANKSHSGTYSCQIKSSGIISLVEVKVEDCGPEYLSTVNTTPSSQTNSTHQSPAPLNSRISKPVLIWYLLFKAGVFLTISITAVLTSVCQKH